MKLLNLTLRVWLLSCISFTLSAQSSISGTIIDDQGEPLPFANVIVYIASDSTMAKGEVTDESGQYQISNLPANTYWISVSYVGLPTYDGNPFELGANDQKIMEPIQIQSAAKQLDEVVVTASKPLIEVKPDKMVFNVEGSVNATGNDAMELLRKSPGVVVDNNDNIMLQGKSGVQIYIDGKPSQLSTSDLAEYLRTLQSDQIEAIEIITNPSSKYDAEGNAGIINIKFKRDKTLGTNGNVSAGFSSGQFQRYNANGSLNYRDKTFNAFGTFGYYDGRNFNDMYLFRDQLGGTFDQKSVNYNHWGGFNFRLGGDLFLNKNSTIGILIDGNLTNYDNNGTSNTDIGSVGSNVIESILVAESYDDGQRSNNNFNVNYKYDNQKGKTLNIDLDYGRFRNDGSGFQPNFYYDGNGETIIEERIYATEFPTDIDIYTAKLDYEVGLWGGKLGTGLKFALVETANTFNFYNVVDGSNFIDEDRTNDFTYLENVNAAYFNYGKQYKKIGFQLGLRLEQTNSEGDLVALKPTNNQNVKRNYLDFFPSGGITYQANEKNSFQLNYSRRIQRPTYQDLNPFENRLDELTFEKGNPFLNPQYAHNIQLTHSYNYMLNTSLSFSRTTDLITRLTDIQDQNSTFITWLNIANQDNVALSVSAPIPVAKGYNIYTNLSGNWTHNTADFGDGKIVDLKALTYNIYQQHTINLPKDFKLEVSGWYNSPSIWGGSFTMAAMGSMDVGVQRRILKNKGNLKVSLSDVFLTNRWSGVSEFGALYMDVAGGWDSRRIRVNFSYQFGNDQVKRARRRTTGLQDESSRIKS